MNFAWSLEYLLHHCSQVVFTTGLRDGKPSREADTRVHVSNTIRIQTNVTTINQPMYDDGLVPYGEKMRNTRGPAKKGGIREVMVKKAEYKRSC